MAKQKTAETEKPYGLDPRFERACAVLACSRPKLWARVLVHLDPPLLGDPLNRLLVQTVAGIAAEREGRGPDSALVVLQRLRRQMGDGKVTWEEVCAASDAIDDAEAGGLPSDDSVADELLPVLKKRLRHKAAMEAVHSWSKKDDLASVVDLAQQADRLGVVDADPGVVLGVGVFDLIAKMRGMERLPTGVSQLDDLCDGGLHRGGLGVAIGDPGGGKSMFLNHVGATAYMNHLNVAMATLELPEAMVMQRFVANVLGAPIAEVGRCLPETTEQLGDVVKLCQGAFACKEFAPHASTVDDILGWVKAREDVTSRKVDLLVVDYADKLVAPGKQYKDDGGYGSMRVVYEGLRVASHEAARWTWTASQARRQKGRDKGKPQLGQQPTRLDLSDAADSMHKVRVADLVVTLNTPDEGVIDYFVAKHRTGRGREATGPLPHDWECGRMVVSD